MYLLDTNVVSELRNLTRANPNVVAWARQQSLENLFLSAITILELEIGCLRLMRKDPVQAENLRTWIEGNVLERFKGRILPVDTAVAKHCARLHVPNLRSERDALIAATAIVDSLTVVTRNTKDFEATGVKLFNPWANP
jgi:toxin FitB